ncbi:MAG: hypothetical protein GY936_14245 [Ignavibacteriae bacterium]|nr:hypothetical protein [Ignavibacteriota bacterium]
MNCDCLERIKEKMLKTFEKDGKYKKPIKSIDIEKALIFGEELEIRTYCNVKVELEGQKKKIKESLMHAYCPFCGVKIIKGT